MSEGKKRRSKQKRGRAKKSRAKAVRDDAPAVAAGETASASAAQEQAAKLETGDEQGAEHDAGSEAEAAARLEEAAAEGEAALLESAAVAEADNSDIAPEEAEQAVDDSGEQAEQAVDDSGEQAEQAVDDSSEQADEDEPAADEDEEGEGAEPERSREELKRALESLIFVAERAVTAVQLGRIVKLRSAEVRELLVELAEDYADRGIQLCEVGGGYQFRSAPSSARYVRALVSQRPVRLTRAQLETLALVAYRQPITRPEIDEVRGVDTGSAVRVLLERGLIKLLGRKDEPGRPLLYGSTPFFLEFFGMSSLKDLPTLREFTELNEENRALFQRKTGDAVEDVEAELAALRAAEEEAAEQAAARAEEDGSLLDSEPDSETDSDSEAEAEPDEPEPEPETEPDEPEPEPETEADETEADSQTETDSEPDESEAGAHSAVQADLAPSAESDEVRDVDAETLDAADDESKPTKPAQQDDSADVDVDDNSNAVLDA